MLRHCSIRDIVMSGRTTAFAGLKASLVVRVLGRFSAIDSSGIRLRLPKKAQALLYFLIAHRGRTIAREELAGLLWSRVEAEQARHSLRQCLTTLRHQLPDAAATALIVEGDWLRLAHSPELASDVEAFQRILQDGERCDLAEAESLCSDTLLHGLSLQHEPFDDWLASERERLARLRIDLLERLAQIDRSEGSVHAGIARARRLVSCDPLREESVRLLMELLTADGQRGAALLEFARLKRNLRDDLCVNPNSATVVLAEQIRRGALCARSPLMNSSASVHENEHGNSRRTRRPFGEPRVMVLPFQNLTTQRRNALLAAALAQDISSALACDRMLAVDAFGYDQPTMPGSTGDWPDYIVTGAIRGFEPHLKVVVQLACGKTRRCLRSLHSDLVDRHERSQDASCRRIAARLAFTIRSNQTHRARDLPFEKLSVAQLALTSAALSRKGQSGNAAAVAMLLKAVDQEPDLGIAHAVLARCFHVQRLMGWLPPGDRRLAQGAEHARLAIELSGDDSEALWMAGLAIMNIEGDLEHARGLIERSLDLNPSSTNARISACFLDCLSGRVSTAISHAWNAADLNPADTSHHVQKSAEATALFIKGDYEAAHAASNAGLAQHAGYAGALRLKIATASLLDRRAEAESTARELLWRDPHASVARMRDYWKWLAPNAPDALDAKLEGWRRAGMPE
jgi:DNA-binding SARP family transcriptional activator